MLIPIPKIGALRPTRPYNTALLDTIFKLYVDNVEEKCCVRDYIYSLQVRENKKKR